MVSTFCIKFLIIHMVGTLMCDADEWLSNFAATHNEICQSSQAACLSNGSTDYIDVDASDDHNNRPSYCCGFCQCGEDCLKYGVCCLGEFDNLAVALSAEDR